MILTLAAAVMNSGLLAVVYPAAAGVVIGINASVATAAATRFVDPDRTSPIAKTPIRLVSSGSAG